MQILRSAIVIAASAFMVLGHKLPSGAADGLWEGIVDPASGEVSWTHLRNITSRSNIPAPVGGGSARALPRRDPGASPLQARDQTGCTFWGWRQDSINNIIDARRLIYASISQDRSAF